MHDCVCMPNYIHVLVLFRIDGNVYRCWFLSHGLVLNLYLYILFCVFDWFIVPVYYCSIMDFSEKCFWPLKCKWQWSRWSYSMPDSYFHAWFWILYFMDSLLLFIIQFVIYFVWHDWGGFSWENVMNLSVLLLWTKWSLKTGRFGFYHGTGIVFDLV